MRNYCDDNVTQWLPTQIVAATLASSYNVLRAVCHPTETAQQVKQACHNACESVSNSCSNAKDCVTGTCQNMGNSMVGCVKGVGNSISECSKNVFSWFSCSNSYTHGEYERFNDIEKQDSIPKPN